MPDMLQRGSAPLLVAIILVLFLLPAFHLEPTAMRAQRAAMNAFWAVSSSVLVIAAMLAMVPSWLEGFQHPAANPTIDLLDLICARLC